MPVALLWIYGTGARLARIQTQLTSFLTRPYQVFTQGCFCRVSTHCWPYCRVPFIRPTSAYGLYSHTWLAYDVSPGFDEYVCSLHVAFYASTICRMNAQVRVCSQRTVSFPSKASTRGGEIFLLTANFNCHFWTRWSNSIGKCESQSGR
jgi:hypothetical protein